MTTLPVKLPLNPRTVELVQKSWAAVLPISDAAAALFYDRLFALDPSLRPLFKNDLAEQKKKLMQTLGVAVDGLSKPQALIPVLEKLGQRHIGYMVQEHHYATVGEALLWTLKEGLGNKFTAEVEAAWKDVYSLVSSVMTTPYASGSAAKAQAVRPPPVPSPTPQPPPIPAASPSSSNSAKAPISPRTVELVQKSWAAVLPISDAAATLFYDRLFALDPSLRPLFKNDLAEQKKKLMQTLGVAVDGLNKPQALIPVLEKLGQRHVGYMVQEHHYATVGEALLWTLKEGLGNKFTAEVEAAWKDVYSLVSSVMIRAAAQVSARPASVAPSAPVSQAPAPAAPAPSAITTAPTEPPQPRERSAPTTTPVIAIPSEIALSFGKEQPIQLQLALNINSDLQEALAEWLRSEPLRAETQLQPQPQREGGAVLGLFSLLATVGAAMGGLALFVGPVRDSEIGLVAAIGALAVSLFTSGLAVGALRSRSRLSSSSGDGRHSA